MHKAVTGTGADRAVGGVRVDAVFGRHHHRLGRSDQMDEGQHIGDHLHHRGVAQLAHVDDLPAHGGEQRLHTLVDRLFAADQHGDLARVGQMHPAGHRALQHADAACGGGVVQALQVFEVGGAHLDPDAAGGQVLEHTARPFDDLAGDGGRWQGCDHHVGATARAGDIVRPMCTQGHQRLGEFLVQVGHGDVKAALDEAAAQALAQCAEADEADVECGGRGHGWVRFVRDAGKPASLMLPGRTGKPRNLRYKISASNACLIGQRCCVFPR